jgi:hypothetical protein
MKPLFNSKGSSSIASTSASTNLATLMLLSPLQSVLPVKSPCKEFAI